MMTELNEQQQAAVAAEGSVMIVAGAGTGKTETLTQRYSRLVRAASSPSRVMGVTFTKKAAWEMRERAAAGLGVPASDKSLRVGTFHSLFLKVVRAHSELFDLSPSFTVIDPDDITGLVGQLMGKPEFVSRLGELKPADAALKLSLLKNQPDPYLSVDDEYLFPLLGQYEAALRAMNCIDFDDMLALPAYLFRTFPEVLEQYRAGLDHLLVDEFQDTSPVQAELVKMLAPAGGSVALTVVGDADQTIYGFRGCTSELLNNFEAFYPAADVVLLEENYRSVPGILDAANRLIEHNPVRRSKTLFSSQNRSVGAVRVLPTRDEYSEVEGVCANVKSLIAAGVPASEIAILSRSGKKPARMFSRELTRLGIPHFTLDGFLDGKELKDVLGFLRFVANPSNDLALKRLLLKTPLGAGIGETTLENLAAPDGELWLYLQSCERQAVQRFIETTQPWFRGSLSVAALIDDFVDSAGYELYVQKTFDNPTERLENIAFLKTMAGGYVSVNDFLDSLDTTLVSPDSDEAVTISTVHRAKGLEWDFVFVTGLEEKLFPSWYAVNDSVALMDEERRVAYVAFTRPRKLLHLSFAQSRDLRDRQTSRFIREIQNPVDSQAA